jgi:peptidoglycan/xylan/chitin deacetylase (PgdA/CDA1 family)
MSSLYQANTPEAFWRFTVDPAPTAAQWAAAIAVAAAELPDAVRERGDEIDALLAQALGEGQFGPDHWSLSPALRLYYSIKPLLPRQLTVMLRRTRHRAGGSGRNLGWPVESGWVRFQWALAQQLLKLTGRSEMPFISFWPDARRYAFVLTHDVERAGGQARVRELADIDASHGFRSSFNFVPEGYRLDLDLIDELRGRGFEVGIHGLKHDGRLFQSHRDFLRQAERINHYLKELDATGFRAPCTHRHPEWMQALEIEYDLSFFDTDPHEPIAGGTMSLWPFQIGRFTELPYTLTQDYTLTAGLGETTPRLWLDKVDFIERHGGMALVNTHPDYLADRTTRRVYIDFLKAMRERSGYWNAIPAEVARWWRARAEAPSVASLPRATESAMTSSGAMSGYSRSGLKYPLVFGELAPASARVRWGSASRT